jgi:hypothetical protein
VWLIGDGSLSQHGQEEIHGWIRQPRYLKQSMKGIKNSLLSPEMRSSLAVASSSGSLGRAGKYIALVFEGAVVITIGIKRANMHEKTELLEVFQQSYLPLCGLGPVFHIGKQRHQQRASC